jgi:hypothetical protein
MQKLTLTLAALVTLTVACKKEHIQPTYNGDLINIHIESNSSTLYVNNLKYVSNINKLDTNIRLFAHDTLRIINNSMSDTQHIKCTVNYNKYYSAIYYNNHIYDSVKACPSKSEIMYINNSLIFNIIYRYKS